MRGDSRGSSHRELRSCLSPAREGAEVNPNLSLLQVAETLETDRRATSGTLVSLVGARWVVRVAVWAIVLTALGVGSLSAQETRLRAVCSTTQVADFVRQVAGDDWEVHCVLAPGQDPHTYQTTTADAAAVAEATLCFENGWHLEGADWMRTLAENAGKPLVTCVTGIEPLKVIEEGESEAVEDPHAWFSPRNAAIYVRNIRDALIEIDPARELQYRSRADAYLMQLSALHQWILKEINRLPREQRVLVTNHDAFGYFCRDYGFRSVTPVGWSTKDEIGGGATIGRRDEVVQSIREARVASIFIETSLNPRLMRQLAEETGVSIGGELYSDSMGPEDAAGESYLGMMRENVLRIVTGLAPPNSAEGE